MNRQIMRDKSRPKTGSISSNSTHQINNPIKSSQKRKISTGREKSMNISKEKPNRKNFLNKKSNNLLSPKTIEYSKIAKKFGGILENNHGENNYYSNILIENIKSNKHLKRNNSNSSEEVTNINNHKYLKDTPNSNKKRSRVASQKNETSLNGPCDDTSKKTDLIKKKVDNPTTKINNEMNSNRVPHLNPLSQNSSHHLENILQENELLKEQNMLLRKQLEIKTENENPIKKCNIANASQVEKLKYLIDKSEKENEDLRSLQNDSIRRAEEKIKLFLKLCRKYTQKIKNLMILYSKIESHNLNSLAENRDTILLELNETIEKFNKTIYHPKLVSRLIELNEINDINSKKLFEEQYDYSIDDGYLTSQLNLLDTIKNLENQLRKLKDHNNHSDKNKNELETIKLENANNLSKKNDEIKSLKKKISEEKLAKEEILNNLNSSKQALRETQKLISKLEEENSKAKRSIKNANEILKDFELLTNSNVNLSNDLKYKDSLINYLESILESNNISFSKFGNFLEKNIPMKNNIDNPSRENKKLITTKSSSENECDSFNKKQMRKDDSNLKINFSSNDKHDSDEYEKYNSKIENYDIRRKSSKEYDKEIIFSSGRISNVKNDIENLDDEIKHLQNKLRTMIETGKN